MKERINVTDQINNFGLGIVFVVSGFFVYIFARFGKWLADNLCQSIMDKYTSLVRNEAKQIAEENVSKLEETINSTISEMRTDIKEIKDSMKTEKQRNHDSIAKNEGVLNLCLETLKEYRGALDVKNTNNNITTHKDS